MPIYEYKCSQCGKTTEKLQKLQDRSESIRCGDCGGTAVQVISKTADPKFIGKDWTPKHYNK